ncbi:MAG TPA: hypothetical protein VG675_17970 [Bryobacteraceae bacterium]|nr:hypothetical protein [Bryobacteraceae bacterium]
MARYYRLDLSRNHRISTEITGYAASTFVYLHSVTQRQEYLQGAIRAARFLTHLAWCPEFQAIPFEMEAESGNLAAYFFDCGIIIRGLLAVWRVTGITEFLDCARSVGKSMAVDFAYADGAYHPIVLLPGKCPAEHDAARWSRSPGCYQLKAAMAWWELAEATGDAALREPYDQVLATSLSSYAAFLPGHTDRMKVMDRLHPFLYFLEGLLPRVSELRCSVPLARGVRRVAAYLREIAPEFERSDVYAQLLRIRLYADRAGVVPLDEEAARFEAAKLREFQAAGEDPHLDGGFYFGRKGGEWLPYVNPVSAAFALQALTLWDEHRRGGPQAHRVLLI